MTHFDAFNGDADGLCALHQLRLADPRDSVLVTGAKRDIALLQRIDAAPGDAVTVLDVSLAANRDAAVALLARDVRIEWFDHHFAGDILEHPLLRATIDPSPDICTGMLVDRHLGGRHRVWAVVAAYGDNLTAAAGRLGDMIALSTERRDLLRRLGETLAYNGYGDRVEDLIVHPATLYRVLHRYVDPFAFMRGEPLFARIDDSRRADLELVRRLSPAHATRGAAAYILPDDAASRRVRGVFANELANREPDLAHAVLTPDDRGGYTVSVRTPRRRPIGADTLCRRFATGGGRAQAAGIDHLPMDRLASFLRELDQVFP
jgi:hypothetical protein